MKRPSEIRLQACNFQKTFQGYNFFKYKICALFAIILPKNSYILLFYEAIKVDPNFLVS